MKLAGLLLLTFISLGTFQLRVLVPEIGSKLPANVVPKENRHWYMTHPAQLRPYIVREIENVKYIIAYDEKTLEVKYLYTNDEDFRTLRGLRVGDSIEVKRDKVQVFPGWEVRAPPVEDGWQPLIGFDMDEVAERDPKDSKLKVSSRPYRLPDEPVFKAMIIGFVKGGN